MARSRPRRGLGGHVRGDLAACFAPRAPGWPAEDPPRAPAASEAPRRGRRHRVTGRSPLKQPGVPSKETAAEHGAAHREDACGVREHVQARWRFTARCVRAQPLPTAAHREIREGGIFLKKPKMHATATTRKTLRRAVRPRSRSRPDGRTATRNLVHLVLVPCVLVRRSARRVSSRPWTCSRRWRTREARSERRRGRRGVRTDSDDSDDSGRRRRDPRVAADGKPSLSIEP